MEKLSQAGRLYLEDYYILSEALKDIDDFLESIIDQVQESLINITDELSIPELNWSLWRNKSSRGSIEINGFAKTNILSIGKKKAKIIIEYKDIRKTDELINPATIIISVWSPGTANEFKKKMQNLSKDFLGEDIYKKEYLELDLESASKSAEKISEFISEQCNKINIILNKMINE